MKKLAYILLITFLAGLVASTWTASASENNGAKLLQAGNKKTAHKAKAKKAEKKHKKQHEKKHGKKANT